MKDSLIRLNLVMYIDKEEDVLPVHNALVEVVERFDYTCFISSAPEENADKKDKNSGEKA